MAVNETCYIKLSVFKIWCAPCFIVSPNKEPRIMFDNISEAFGGIFEFPCFLRVIITSKRYTAEILNSIIKVNNSYLYS